MALTNRQIENRFSSHPATAMVTVVDHDEKTTYQQSTAELMQELRQAYMNMAIILNTQMGPFDPRYAALAMTALEESAMWANKAIATANYPVEFGD
jgi:hypothetical protein